MQWKDDLIITHDADDDLDYEFDWSSWLSAGDTIDSYSMTYDAGITGYNESSSSDAVTYWIKGGTPGELYRVSCKIITAGGRTTERSIRYRITQL